MANLPFRYSDDDVVALFAEVAPITSAQVVMDDDGRSRGYGSSRSRSRPTPKLIGPEFHGSDVGGRDLIVRPGKQSRRRRRGRVAPGADADAGRGGAAEAVTVVVAATDCAGRWRRGWRRTRGDGVLPGWGRVCPQ